MSISPSNSSVTLPSEISFSDFYFYSDSDSDRPVSTPSSHSENFIQIDSLFSKLKINVTHENSELLNDLLQSTDYTFRKTIVEELNDQLRAVGKQQLELITSILDKSIIEVCIVDERGNYRVIHNVNALQPPTTRNQRAYNDKPSFRMKNLDSHHKSEFKTDLKSKTKLTDLTSTLGITRGAIKYQPGELTKYCRNPIKMPSSSKQTPFSTEMKKFRSDTPLPKNSKVRDPIITSAQPEPSNKARNFLMARLATFEDRSIVKPELINTDRNKRQSSSLVLKDSLDEHPTLPNPRRPDISSSRTKPQVNLPSPQKTTEQNSKSSSAQDYQKLITRFSYGVKSPHSHYPSHGLQSYLTRNERRPY